MDYSLPLETTRERKGTIQAFPAKRCEKKVESIATEQNEIEK
jgi:hypothetical protein